MIWFVHALILAIGLTCQSTVAPFVEVLGVRPDWLLLGVVFLALHAPAKETILAAWIVGLAADLMTLEQFGLLGLSYAVAAFLVLEVREYLFRYRALAQFGVTASVALFVQCMWALYVAIRYGSHDGLTHAVLVRALPASLYTGLWAIPAHRVLLWIGRPLGLVRSRGISRGGVTVGRRYV